MHSRPASPGDTDGVRFIPEPAFPYFSPTEEPVILNLKCVDLEELYDCIAWSVHLLVQTGASMTKSSSSSFMTLRRQQSRTESQPDGARGIDHPIRGLNPYCQWWSTLALFWIAFAERRIDNTELMSALAAACEDHFPVNSNLSAGRVDDTGNPS